MNIKTLMITALIGASLSNGQVFAWGDHYVKPHKVERITTHIHFVPAQPSTLHQHPANPYTNDTLHSHPNGNNHHAHNYGAGSGSAHTHHGYTYAICPYPRH